MSQGMSIYINWKVSRPLLRVCNMVVLADTCVKSNIQISSDSTFVRLNFVLPILVALMLSEAVKRNASYIQHFEITVFFNWRNLNHESHRCQ